MERTKLERKLWAMMGNTGFHYNTYPRKQAEEDIEEILSIFDKADALADALEKRSHDEGQPFRPPVHCLGEHKKPEHFTCTGCDEKELCKALAAYRSRV